MRHGCLIIAVLWTMMSLGLGGCARPSFTAPDLMTENRQLRERLKALGGSVADLKDLARANEYEAEGWKAETKSARERGREMIATAGRWVYRISLGMIGAGMLVLLASLVIQIGRRGALTGILVGIGGLWLAYAITVYGVIVSETVTWLIFIGAAIVGSLWVFRAVQVQIRGVTAHAIARKRANAGEVARDAIGLLAVPQGVKSRLDDAWQLLIRRAGRVESAAEASAADLLTRFRLPVPNAAAASGPGGLEELGLRAMRHERGPGT